MGESPANPQPMVGPSPRYLAQVKAFLSYIEDVEVDEEIIEDILTGLEDELDPPPISDGEQSGAEPDAPSESVSDEDEDEFAQEGVGSREQMIRLANSFGHFWLARDAWTEEEVKQMIQFLKQRGRPRKDFHLRLSPLISVRRDEGLPHRVCDCAPNPDRPSPLCVWDIAGEGVCSVRVSRRG